MRNRNQYSTEFKIAMVEEFKGSNLSQKQFCEKKGLVLQTFLSWWAKFKFYNEQDKSSLIEVAAPIKAIINETKSQRSSTFVLEKNGFKMEFELADLSTVIEVIFND